VISVVQLGTVDYATGLRLQQHLVELHKQERIGDVLLLLEHAPVITLGRNAKSKNLIATPEFLACRGVELFDCDRGGDVTFHGPGQLVGYPIFDLRTFPAGNSKRNHLGALDYVRGLEEALIRTCADFGIPAKRVAGLTGVWIEANLLSAEQKSSLANFSVKSKKLASDPCEAKIAAIGVHISRGVTSHGFALNVNTDLSYFDLIVPCGIADKRVTSMKRELNREINLLEVAHAVTRNFGTVFQTQILWLQSLDDLLGQNLGVPMRVPENVRRIRHEDDSTWA